MVLTVLQAMSEFEGYPILTSRSRRNNNPGDLIWGDEAEAFGALHGDREGHVYKGYSGFAVFPDGRTGWRAFQRWLKVPAKFHKGPITGYFFDHSTGTTLVGGYCGATLQQIIYRFAPPEENKTAAYLAGVCHKTNLRPETVITLALLQTPEAA